MATPGQIGKILTKAAGRSYDFPFYPTFSSKWQTFLTCLRVKLMFDKIMDHCSTSQSSHYHRIGFQSNVSLSFSNVLTFESLEMPRFCEDAAYYNGIKRLYKQFVIKCFTMFALINSHINYTSFCCEHLMQKSGVNQSIVLLFDTADCYRHVSEQDNWYNADQITKWSPTLTDEGRKTLFQFRFVVPPFS